MLLEGWGLGGWMGVVKKSVEQVEEKVARGEKSITDIKCKDFNPKKNDPKQNEASKFQW